MNYKQLFLIILSCAFIIAFARFILYPGVPINPATLLDSLFVGIVSGIIVAFITTTVLKK